MKEHYFFEPINDPETIELADGFNVIIKDYYCEITIKMSTDFCCYFVLYLIPKDDYSFYLCTYWEDSLDFMLDASNDTHWIVAKTWPTLYSLLQNGSKDRYSEGAMIRMNNYDNGNVEWFLTTTINGEDIAAAINSDVFLEKVAFVKDLTLQICDELEKEPDKKTLAWEGIKQGANEATKEYLRNSIEDNFTKLIGSLFKH